jgi:hypothetical protein
VTTTSTADIDATLQQIAEPGRGVARALVAGQRPTSGLTQEERDKANVQEA